MSYRGLAMCPIQDDEDEFAEEAHPNKLLVNAVIDVDDLTQLPNIDKQREHRLKRIGYDTLYEIAEATIHGLAEDAHVTYDAAQTRLRPRNFFLNILRSGKICYLIHDNHGSGGTNVFHSTNIMREDVL
jgi:hypothetical protein